MDFQAEGNALLEASALEMNHRSTSGQQRPRNRVRWGKKKRGNTLKVQNCSLCQYSDVDCILGQPRPYWELVNDAKSGVSKDSYFNTLNNLQNAIKSKRPGLLATNIVYIYATHVVVCTTKGNASSLRTLWYKGFSTKIALLYSVAWNWKIGEN